MELFFGHANTRTDGWTDRRGSRNSYLDMYIAPTMCMRTYIVLFAMKNGKLLQDTVLCNVTASTHSKNPEA